MSKFSMSSHENMSPQVLVRVQKEIRQLVKQPPEGIKYVPLDEGSLSEVVAEIEGPVGTPYENGIFRMKLQLGGEYPAAPPKGVFLTRIYHPNVSSSGEICVNTLKRDWSADHTILHVLQVIRCLLIVPFPESSLNDEAGKLFMESYEEYARRAKIMTSIHAIKPESMIMAGGQPADGNSEDDGPNALKRKANLPSKARALTEKQKAAKKKSLRRL